MEEKNTTIDSLAIMVKEGFDGVGKRFDQMATKEDLNSLKLSMDSQFSEVTHRLDNIEFLIAKQHETRIERLEDRVEKLMEATGLAKI